MIPPPADPGSVGWQGATMMQRSPGKYCGPHTRPISDGREGPTKTGRRFGLGGFAARARWRRPSFPASRPPPAVILPAGLARLLLPGFPRGKIVNLVSNRSKILRTSLRGEFHGSTVCDLPDDYEDERSTSSRLVLAPLRRLPRRQHWVFGVDSGVRLLGICGFIAYRLWLGGRSAEERSGGGEMSG